MNFADALVLLLDGHCIARPAWLGGSFLHVPRAAPGTPRRFLPLIVRRDAAGRSMEVQASTDDLVAVDWELATPNWPGAVR